MKVRLGTIIVVAALAADGQSGAAEMFPLPPRATAVVTNAAAVMEAKVFNGAKGGALRYRMLSPATVEAGRRYPLVLFLLVAGRCVSTDQKVQASIRVMPACYLTGQAAGFAAALAADAVSGNVHSVDVKMLQRKLKDFGAYLPNA